MDVVAYLSDPLLYSLRAATRGTATVYAAADTRALDALLTLHPAAAAVIDPQAPGLRDATALLPVFDRHAAVQVIAYTTLSPSGMRGYGLLASHGVRHLVLRGVDDAPDRMRELIAAVPGDTLSELLLTMIEPLLDRLSAPIARSIRELFRAPHAMRDVRDLARAAGIGRRTLDRALERAGVAAGGMLVRAARVVRVYHYLQGSRVHLKSIASKLGYLTPRGLTSEVCLMTGFLPSSLARELDAEDFLARIAGRLWRLRPGEGAERTSSERVSARRSAREHPVAERAVAIERMTEPMPRLAPAALRSDTPFRARPRA